LVNVPGWTLDNLVLVDSDYNVFAALVADCRTLWEVGGELVRYHVSVFVNCRAVVEWFHGGDFEGEKPMKSEQIFVEVKEDK
jgi:hypothetical protein